MSADGPTTPSNHVAHARDSRGNAAEPGIVRDLAELARELHAEPDMPSMLQHIVTATVAEIGGADFGGISLLETSVVRAAAATDPIVARLDAVQSSLAEGPCMSSLREQVTVRSDDLVREQRWPRFSAAAVSEGVHAMLSVQLFVEGDNLGALNLYGGSVEAFTVLDEHIAMAFAAHAAVAMKGSRTASNLTIALRSRDVIGQGKGILMERYKISEDEAFQLMIVSSQNSHRKLRDIAEELTTTGELRIK